MKRVHVLVEGQTEEAFVGRVVRPHLHGFEVHVESKVILTKRVMSGPDRQGGVSSWPQIERDLRLLLHDSAVAGVSTMIDYYGLPADTPGMATRPASALAAALHVEAAMEADIRDARFRAHLSLHEFEALLFADPHLCGEYLRAPTVTRMMSDAITQCGEPELVDDDPMFAPSKRLFGACPTYRKTLDGPALAERIGLASIRSACPHFDRWVEWLESLGA
jgi:hypothetical protein